MMVNVGFSEENPSVFSDSIKFEEDFIEDLKKYNEKSKLNNKDYRDKINRLYNNLGMIKPIDNEINNVLYFDDYSEVGVVLNKKNISLNQIWTEYRLIYNEKIKEDDKIMENSFVLDNFDDLFDKISKKIDGVDKYIDDLNSLKRDIDVDNDRIRRDRESFEIEKINFENYRREEIARLENKELELNVKLEKINKLIKLFEEKVNSVVGDNDEKC